MNLINILFVNCYPIHPLIIVILFMKLSSLLFRRWWLIETPLLWLPVGTIINIFCWSILVFWSSLIACPFHIILEYDWIVCLLYNFYWELQCAYFWGVLWIFSSDGFLWLGTFLKINDGFLWSFTINDWVHLWSFMIINDGFLWLGTFGKLYTHKWWFLVIGYFSRSLLSF